MGTLKAVLAGIAVGWALAGRSNGQVTNILEPVPPPTVLERAEIATGVVIVKGTAAAGTMSVSGATLSVVCEEVAVAGSSQKSFGVRLGIAADGQPEDRTVIDYDELAGLVASIDYLAKVDWSVTSLSSFDAGYTTKAGLRLAAFSSQRAGRIEYSIRSSRMNQGLLLGLDQLAQLRQLLAQAKGNLDGLRGG